VDTRWDAGITLSASAADGLSYWSASPDPTYSDEYIRFYASASTHFAENSDGGSPNGTSIGVQSPTSLHEYSFAREGESAVRYEQDGNALATLSTSVPTTNLRLFMQNSSSSETLVYDWARVRLYQASEPSVGKEAEEDSSGYCVAVTPTPVPTPTATPNPAPWWREVYQFRQVIRITGNADTGSGAGETVRIQLDTASLVNAGKMQPNGDDLRIVYFDGTENHELERQLFEMDFSVTDIWFVLQAPIPSGVETLAYFVYYGYSGEVGQPLDLQATPTTLEFFDGDGHTIYQDTVLQCGIDADIQSDALADAGTSASQEDTVEEGCGPADDRVHLTLAEWDGFYGEEAWQVPAGARIIEDSNDPAASRIRLWGGGDTGSEVEASTILVDWLAGEATWNQRLSGVPWASNPGAGALLLNDISGDLLGFDGISTEFAVTANMADRDPAWGTLHEEGSDFLFEYAVATLQRWVTGRRANHGLAIHIQDSGEDDGVLWLSVEAVETQEHPRLTVVFYPHYQPEPVTGFGLEELKPQ
jgi:hypothetical protein